MSAELVDLPDGPCTHACKALNMIRSLVVVSLVVSSAVGCSSSTSSACGPGIREALDPNSLVHVLPGAPTPHYESTPPTSGAHQPTPPITGVQTAPIAPQVQVGILEQGRVLLQYRGLDPTDIRALRELASPMVVVAPARSLPGKSTVVATAWVTKQSCDRLDVPTLEKFVISHKGKGPGRP